MPDLCMAHRFSAHMRCRTSDSSETIISYPPYNSLRRAAWVGKRNLSTTSRSQARRTVTAVCSPSIAKSVISPPTELSRSPYESGGRSIPQGLNCAFVHTSPFLGEHRQRAASTSGKGLSRSLAPKNICHSVQSRMAVKSMPHAHYVRPCR
jgi:hypothetical protein